MNRLLLLLLPLFAGCAEFDRLTGTPLDLAIELKAPENSQAQLQVSGPMVSETYSDNGIGLQSTMKLWPGEYEARLNRIEKGPIRYQGILKFSNRNANISQKERLQFSVREEDSGKLRLQGVYEPLTGSLNVTVNGLPFGYPLEIRYADLSGKNDKFLVSQPPALPPGRYGLYLDPVELEGKRYLPDRSEEIVEVKAGEFTDLAITYTQEEAPQ